MDSINQRVTFLAEQYLGISGPDVLDTNISEFGVNSIDAITFIEVLSKEFGFEITPQVVLGFATLRDIVSHIERLSS